ncbi:MAG: helix-hairpin-helix domain-containing protein [Fibrobacteria bacterium]
MFTKAEKGYLALTLCFLAAGSGIKVYRRAAVQLGPFPDPSSSPAVSIPPVSVSAVSPFSASADSQALSAAVATGDGKDTVSGRLARLPADAGAGGERASEANPARHEGKPAFPGKVSLNRAGASELTHVKGIGEKTALSILDYRKSHGPFRDLRDLLQVKGIGEKKLEKLTPFLIL